MLINASLATVVNDPIGLTISGNNLYAVSGDWNGVDAFNATTGAAITSGFMSPSGLNNSQSIAVLVPEPSTWAAVAFGRACWA